MLNWAVVFFVVAVMAGLASFFQLTAGSNIADILSLVFLALSALCLVLGLRATRSRSLS